MLKPKRSPNVRPASNNPSIFSNFEFVQLTSDERIYLHLARIGDVFCMQELMGNPELKLNYNCMDFMGRNALHLAVDSENMEMIKWVMEKVAWDCIEEALLHAISKGNLSIVHHIVDHPKYINEEKHVKLLGKKDPFFRTEEKYQYPPDITPLILAAHNNDHEMIQLFLARGYTIESPHAIHCQCYDCRMKQEKDSLKRSRSRLNAYRALASPAYIALSSPDPITATFELRQEMMGVSQVEKEFKKDYLDLVDQCMDFACDCMNLCRGTQEMEAIMGDDSNTGKRDNLGRLRMAVHYREKRFVGHSNTQQHLTNIWYGKEMLFFHGLSWHWKFAMIPIFPAILPFLFLIYIIYPDSKIGRMLRCPVSKFITHTVSHFVFLILLGVATFGIEDIIWTQKHTADSGDDSDPNQTSSATHGNIISDFRPARWTVTTVQLLIVFWVAGNLLLECKQIYTTGAKEHFRQYYNFVDWAVLSLYLASYALRFTTQYRLQLADAVCGNATDTCTGLAKEALENDDDVAYQAIKEEAIKYSYFTQASRFEWLPHDPEILSDILFAVANVLSFARTTYVMPSHEILGPLQISLGRMFSDIIRFMVVFFLVLIAFMVGMTNLYRYYGTIKNEEGTDERASQSFRGLPQTVYTLFFSIFGLIALDKLPITVPQIDGIDVEHQAKREASTVMVDRVGLLMFAVFQVAVTIVLVNMLIAMMSHSFEAIQCDNDVEWKYARTKLWLNFIDEGSTLPVPFNMIPTLKTVKYFFKFFKDLFANDEEDDVVYDFSRRRENVLIEGIEKTGLVFNPKTTYSDIIQRLMRRFLFHMDRKKKERLSNEAGGGAVRDIVTLEAEEEISSAKQENEEEDDTSRLIRVKTQTDDGQESTEYLNLPKVDMRFSSSPRQERAVSLRELQNRTTVKRKRTTQSVTAPSLDQIQAIQRSQRLLDARLQDIQAQFRQQEAPIQEALDKTKFLITDNHKSMMQLLQTMQAMHTDVMLMSQALSQFTGLSPTKEKTPKSQRKGLKSATKKVIAVHRISNAGVQESSA